MICITKTTILTMLILFGLTACSPGTPAATPSVPETAANDAASPEPEPTITPTAVPTQTPVPEPTATPEPSPTATLPPTATPQPSPTPDLTGGGSGKIVFASNRNGETEFFIMNYDGSEQQPWDNPAEDAMPIWSPDGAKIVFSSRRGGAGEIYAANTDGSGLIQLTDNDDPISDNNPAWSPDGSQIIFDTNLDNGIYVMSANGSERTELTNNRTGFKGFASWSPDRSQIVFNWAYDLASDTPADTEIYVMNADGSGIMALTDNEFQDIGAVWSPDGAKIAFHSNRDGNFEIYVMNADGSDQTRLTDDEVDEFMGAWSPDGNLIVYTAVTERDENGIANTEIYIMHADGSGQTNLTNSPGRDSAPHWLP